MNILKANGVDLAYDSFGDETAEAILLIAGAWNPDDPLDGSVLPRVGSARLSCDPL